MPLAMSSPVFWGGVPFAVSAFFETSCPVNMAAAHAQRDVGFIAVSATGQKSPVVWLTSGPGDASAPHLARYGTSRLLASWSEGTDAKLSVLSAAGAVLEGPITASVGVAERDAFGRWPSGDVGWAEGAGAALHVSRLRFCP